MTFTVDWANKIVDSSSSITDLLAARNELRILEASTTGILYPSIFTYKELPIGGGALLPGITFINGYVLRFPTAGSYEVSGGNWVSTILMGAGVAVERRSAAAYAVTAVGSGGGGSGTAPTSQDNANAVWSHPFASKLLTVAKYLGLK